MSGTSSAVPANLDVFVTRAGGATDSLATAAATSKAVIDAFYDAPCDPRFRPAGSDAAYRQVATVVSDDRTDERWIAGIRQAFLDADSDTLSDSGIASSLKAAGIDPGAPAALTADEPVYQGATMYSGWSDDPVSTGAGHFLEVEEDLAMPGALAPLRWARTYSSRHLRSEGQGRGWYGWATTRLEVGGDQVVYFGPDGQVAPFARVGGDYLRHAGVEAELAGVDGGYRLSWRWNGRFPGMRWTFDVDGALVAIDDPEGGRTAVERVAGRLVGLRHEGGRRLGVAWEGDRVVGLDADDGRTVRYRYEGDALVGVERPAGAMTYRIDAAGRLAAVVDADGVVLADNDYDDDGRVVAQRSPFGHVATYTYLAPNTVVVGDDEGGPRTLFRHDQAGRLVELVLADGSRSTRTFDEMGNPVQVVDVDGSVTRRRFDIDGNCVRIEGPGGAVRTFTHDDAGRVVATRDEGGGESRFTYEGDEALPRLVEGPGGVEHTFEIAAGRVVAHRDNDGVSERFGVDDDGQVVARTDGNGDTTTYRYHPSGRLCEVVDPTGATERWDVDGAGRSTAYTSPAGDRTEQSFSPAGRLLAVSDAAGRTLRIRWGAHGAVEAIVDPGGHEVSYTWDRYGRRTSRTLPGGSTWQLDHDVLGRLTGVVDPSGERWGFPWGPGDEERGYRDPLGGGVEVVRDREARRVTTRTSGGHDLVLDLDGAGRLVGGSADGAATTCALERDDAGRPVRLWIDGVERGRWSYTPGGRLASLGRPDGALWTWSYDAAGRPTEVGTPHGVDRLAFDGAGRLTGVGGGDGDVALTWEAGVLTSVRRGSEVTAYGWDAAGRLLEEGPAQGPPARYRYDGRGLLEAVTDPTGATTGYGHDARARVAEVVTPAGGRWRIERDANDRVVAVTDPLDRRTGYDLDASGRVAAMVTADGEEYRYERDADGEVTDITVGGRSHLHIDRAGAGNTLRMTAGGRPSSLLTIDALGRLTRYATPAGDTRWTYDDDGALVVTATGDGTTTRTHLDADGRPLRVELPVLGAVHVERDADGRPVRLVAPGLERRWERDVAGDVIRYTEALGGATSATTIERDDAGRVRAVDVDGERTELRHDPAGQLVAADGPLGARSWAYDGAGRLVATEGPEGHRTLSYDAADQLVDVDGPEGRHTYSYDARGRRHEHRRPDGTVRRYRWSAFDRLVAVDRVDATGALATTTFDVDPLGALLAVDGRPAGLLPGCAPGDGPVRSGDRTVLEVAGSVVAEVTDGGTVALLSADWRGGRAGGDLWPAGTDPVVGAVAVDGLVWMGQRVYDPKTHQFLTRDPLAGEPGWPGSLTNGYLYAHNDPLAFLDPSGLKPMTAAEAGQQMQSWKQGHWKQLVVTLAAVGVMVLVPEAGVPMLLGALAGGAGTVANAMIFNHGHIDWGEVIMNTALGGATGGLGATVAGSLGETSQLVRIAGNTTFGAVAGGGSTAVDSYASNRPITLEDVAIGAAGGALPGLIPTKDPADFLTGRQQTKLQAWQDAHPGVKPSEDIGALPKRLRGPVARAIPKAEAYNNRLTLPPTVASNGTGVALAPPPDVPAATSGLPVTMPPPEPAVTCAVCP